MAPHPAFGHPLPASGARGQLLPFSPRRGEKVPEGRMRGVVLVSRTVSRHRHQLRGVYPRPMRHYKYVLAALLLFASGPMQARSLHWSSIDVDARLDRDGVLEVSETQAFVFDGDWNGGERRFNVRHAQSLELLGVERIDGATAVSLSGGSLASVDQFELLEGNV